MNFTEKEKCIQTNYLNITGNIMTWEGTMIQLSNVSYVTTQNMEPAKLPLWAIGTVVVGICLYKFVLLLSIVLVLFGAIDLVVWYKENEARKKSTILTIRMNSGNSLQFLFSDRIFLQKVLSVLEKIIIDGGIGSQNISIDLSGSQFSGDARVLNNLGINS